MCVYIDVRLLFYLVAHWAHVLKFMFLSFISLWYFLSEGNLGNNLPSNVDINSDVSVLIVHIKYIWEDILFAIL